MRHALALLSLLLATPTFAQLEEVVVTGSVVNESLPGVVLQKKGDFLLLQVRVANDTRDAKLRKQEIYQTLQNAIKKAADDKGIELSLVENEFVIPLNENNYRVPLGSGSRPDTSVATIRVKTAIDKNASKANKLVNKMRSFVTTVKLDGRTQLVSQGDVDVSLVGPRQYRDEILALFAQDIEKVTNQLGDEYKVVVHNIDRPVDWVRSGPLSLTLFIPYRYTVIPDNINSILVPPEY